MIPGPCVPGSGHLEIELVSGQSAATSVWAAAPLKILVPRPRGPAVWACLSSLGGGLLPGDQTLLTLNLGGGARCFLSTQASTKVYRNPTAQPCGNQLRAELGPGSLLIVAPDPVQPFAGSYYQQRQQFRLAAESGLVLVDWLGSGRPARGERWAFRRFQSRTEVFSANSRTVLDSVVLDPADGPLAAPHRMGRFNCLAVLAVIGPALQRVAEGWLREIAGLPVTARAPLVCSASPILSGALVRLAGESVEAVGAEIRRLLAFVPEILHENPWSRKW